MKADLDRKDILRLIYGFGFPSWDMAMEYYDKVDIRAGMGSEVIEWKRGVFDDMSEEELFRLYTSIKTKYEYF